MAVDLMNELMSAGATAVADDVEKAAESSGELPPGKYAARLEAAQSKDVAELPMWELLFVITAGAYRGRKVRYSLWMGTKETDKEGDTKTPEQIEEQKKLIRNEFFHTAGVLGLAVKAEKDGKKVYAIAAGKHDFRDVRGAECVIKTKLRAYKTQAGEDRMGAEVDKFGVLSFSDPKAKGVARPAAGTVPPLAPAASPAGQDYSDLASGV